MSYVLTRVTRSKLFQVIATMTYTRSHTRPSQKDLGCVVYPLNKKSLSEYLNDTHREKKETCIVYTFFLG
jgi:hypothetical protein